MNVADLLRYATKPVVERDFTYAAYCALLDQLSDERFAVVRLRDYDQTRPSDRVVFSLRHDIDADLESASSLARLEHDHGLRATYFVLHTAPYYGITRRGFTRRQPAVRDALLEIQDRYGHEVGFHNDLVTLHCIYGVDALAYARDELAWLRDGGLDIVGTAAHGSDFAAQLGYDNRYLFSDVFEKLGAPLPEAPNHERIIISHGTSHREIEIPKTTLAELGFAYEAYHLDHNIAYADCYFIDGRRWHPRQLDLDNLQQTDRVILLTHPVHWGAGLAQKYRRAARRFVRNRAARLGAI